MNNPDPIAIGKYRGFDMELQFSSGVVHCYELSIKSAVRFQAEYRTIPI